MREEKTVISSKRKHRPKWSVLLAGKHYSFGIWYKFGIKIRNDQAMLPLNPLNTRVLLDKGEKKTVFFNIIHQTIEMQAAGSERSVS